MRCEGEIYVPAKGKSRPYARRCQRKAKLQAHIPFGYNHIVHYYCEECGHRRREAVRLGRGRHVLLLPHGAWR